MTSSEASVRCVHVYFFFFSSRRRHTRCSRDWSSDVCSSDLDRRRVLWLSHTVPGVQPGAAGGAGCGARDARNHEIGRGACRGRGEISGGGGSFKKKKKESGGRALLG